MSGRSNAKKAADARRQTAVCNSFLQAEDRLNAARDEHARATIELENAIREHALAGAAYQTEFSKR